MASDPKRAVSACYPITPDTDLVRLEGNLKTTGLCITATVAGNVGVKLPSGTLIVAVPVGTTMYHGIEVIGIVSASTTATATYTALG